jgi:hypothetical protein
MDARFYLLLLWFGLAFALAKVTKAVYKTWTTPISEGETKIDGSAFFIAVMMFAFVLVVSLITHGLAKVKLGQQATTIFFITYIAAFIVEHLIFKKQRKVKRESQEIVKKISVWQNVISYVLGVFLLPLFWYMIHLIMKRL